MAGKTYQRYRKRNTHVRTIRPAGLPEPCPHCDGTGECPGCAGSSESCGQCRAIRSGECVACSGSGERE